MKHINITNWQGNITDWTKFNYVYGGLDETIADRVNLSIPGTNLRNYIKKSDNLISLPNIPSTTTNGITYKVENGVITVNGTATAQTNIQFTNLNRKVLNQPFIFALLNDISYSDVAIIAIDFVNDHGYTFTLNKNNYRKFTLTDKVLEDFKLKINNGASISNMVLKPMLVESETAPTTYEPYGSIVLVENVGKVDLGTLGWAKDTTTRPADGATIHAWYAQLDDCKLNVDGYANMFLDGYTVDTVAAVDYGGFSVIKDKLIGGADSNHRIWLYNSAYQNMTQQELQAELSGKILQFELATPKITIFGSVDLGSFTYNYQAATNLFYSYPRDSSILLPKAGGLQSNPMGYVTLSPWAVTTDKVIYPHISSDYFAVGLRDNAYQNNAEGLKNALNGKVMIYELASQPSANMLGMVKPSNPAPTAIEDSMSLDELLEPANEER